MGHLIMLRKLCRIHDYETIEQVLTNDAPPEICYLDTNHLAGSLEARQFGNLRLLRKCYELVIGY
jgi:hypothetical protein